ncbi:hypothetical protein GCM10027598_83550 [Amycolatopsis oliviviridis]|uniref:Uncharacterized protein n=1 Tax=Amycolatopsis oliviviridis TaxID=1471590 RepID=A0ABQ3L974_9PSEU|nr:hypothetical protein [Amycolatopsis oliviviridis]GHH07058.1 hypothetical protein GCM10017790_13450 [Amycolatopsis oliviviridis]
MTTRICETRRRPGAHAAAWPQVSVELEKLPRLMAKPEPPASLLDGVLTAVRRLEDTAPAFPRRFHLPRWTTRDRRVQRLRGWLSGLPG